MLKSFLYFIRLILLRYDLIFTMAKREIATQYIGSFLGFAWTFINPLIMILVLWVVFGLGFRVTPLNNVPFVVWLTAGLSAWTVFADIVNGSAGAIVGNDYLIKKTMFPSPILPVVKIVSSLMTHIVFIVVLIGLVLSYKMPLSIYNLQCLYYILCLSVLSLGIGWAVSALNVFIRDVKNIVGVLLQIGFWVTPIFWDIHIMPKFLQFILKLNPVFYIVQGYRESFIYFVPFWEHATQTIYFWVVSMFIFTMGALIFRKLKPQFADVL